MGFFSSSSPQPKDIYMEILTRLDAKSLARFKLVSKHWYHFLSHPSFIKTYSKKRPYITGFFYQSSKTYPEKLRYVSINTKQEDIINAPSCLGFLNDHAILYGSCNGLLHWFCSWDQQFISNPLTNKFISLPWPFLKSEFFACGIAFDPILSVHFKVVVLMVQSESGLRSRTFSSETMEWSEIRNIYVSGNGVKPLNHTQGIFLNGFMHWELNNNSMLVYDVNSHYAGVIQCPVKNGLADRLGFHEPGCLGEFSGKLHYCRIIGTLLCVWVASTNFRYSSPTIWVGEQIVNLSTVMCKRIRLRSYESQALAFLDDCKGALLSVKGKIIAYWFEDGVVDEVCKVKRNGGSYVQPSIFFPFVHSLALFDLSSFNNGEQIVNKEPTSSPKSGKENAQQGGKFDVHSKCTYLEQN